MNTHADKTHENKRQSVANAVSQKKSDSKSTFQFEDNRPEAIQMRKLQEMASNRSQAKQVTPMQNNTSTNTIQRIVDVSLVSNNDDKKKIRAEGKVKDFKGGTTAGNYGWVGVTRYRSEYEISDKKYINTGEVGPLHNDFTNPERGHVLAKQNGGDGGDPENVFAQDGGTNNGVYKSFEMEMRKDLNLYGKNANVKFTSYLAGDDIEIDKIADEGLSDAMSISSEDTDSN